MPVACPNAHSAATSTSDWNEAFSPARIDPEMFFSCSEPGLVRRRWQEPLWVALAIGLGMSLSGCVGGTVTALSSPPTTNEAFTLTVQRSPEGLILATGTGFTLYDFRPDTPNHSTCLNVGCVYQWPPLLAKGAIQVGPGVSRDLLGRVTRPDGYSQLTYGGHPLYTYILDTKPGSVTGQAIDQDGGPWYVLTPQGSEIHAPFTVHG
jgi:predicted lipoprotein with Yx(FWY)xxD motif